MHSLFNYPINASEIMAKKRALKRELIQKPFLISKKIAIMSGSTIGEVKNILELFLLDCGINPTFYIGEYSLYYENLVFDDGSLRDFAPDIIYIHCSNKNIINMPDFGETAQQVKEKLQNEYLRLETLCNAALTYDCPVILNNFELPLYRPMGNYEATAENGKVRFVSQLNLRLADFANTKKGLFINDINYLSALHGIDNWCDNTAWYGYKYCLGLQYIPHLAQSVANIIKSVFGKNKKSIICDLDNTLWGGVVGDDGVDGISIGKETPSGMAFSEIQGYLKELSQQGVLLNVCSKNELETAKSGFSRADSILKYEDFTTFEANWNVKSENIKNIIERLNILQDSFVFFDDNPAERLEVSQTLKDIAAPELAATEDFLKHIDRNGYFEVTAISSDDKNRAQFYKQNLVRQQNSESFKNYDEYLKSLNMSALIEPFEQSKTARITQLINKTNQFNLTTRRYSEKEIEQLLKSDNFISLYGQLSDKFGDNGIVTAIIAQLKEDTAYIDLFIMSCRVFKRNLEFAMADVFVEHCKKRKIKTIVGVFKPTEKNKLVKDFYASLGFKELLSDEQQSTFVLENITEYDNKNNSITILGE